MSSEPGIQSRSWENARQKTIDHWLRLRESIGSADSVKLLQEINLTNELCEQAKRVAAGRWGRCDYCLASQQFGGCAGISLRMSECVVEYRWNELSRLVDEFITNLENLEIPIGFEKIAS
ncbi:MAG: hypothetical protein V3S30_08985 [Thermoanaerobaculia bacterium]